MFSPQEVIQNDLIRLLARNLSTEKVNKKSREKKNLSRRNRKGKTVAIFTWLKLLDRTQGQILH